MMILLLSLDQRWMFLVTWLLGQIHHVLQNGQNELAAPTNAPMKDG
jgi:hypothetical protein